MHKYWIKSANMPIYKTTYNILVKVDECELYNRNWDDSDQIYIPPTEDWDYKREMTVDDVDIWEVLYESTGGIGVYAAQSPYAEFYMITSGFDETQPARWINGHPYGHKIVETFYGPGSQKKVFLRARELSIPLGTYKEWVEPEDMWLHDTPESIKKYFT